MKTSFEWKGKAVQVHVFRPATMALGFKRRKLVKVYAAPGQAPGASRNIKHY